MKEISFSKCKNEQQFKMKYIRDILKRKYNKVFCIETEETVKGFPDVMCLTMASIAIFFEFKYSSASGKIKFQPTQPSFYRQNSDLDIWVVAFNQKTKEVVEFPVWNMSTVKGERKYYLNEQGEVQL